MLGLAALVARRFLRNPRFFALIIPLYGRLQRAVRRFERAVSRPVVVRKASGVRPVAARAPGVRLPTGKGWLVRELGWEAAGYGSQLQHLLDDPAMRAALASVPAVGRILRPICRMLGVTTLEQVVAKVTRVRKARVPKPKAAREKPWSPGPIRPPWGTREKLA